VNRLYHSDVYTRLERPRPTRPTLAEEMAEAARVLALPPEDRPAIVPPAWWQASHVEEPDDLPW
jgi:hypothetical protein